MTLEDIALKLAMRARTEDGLCPSAARVLHLQMEILTALRNERERCAKIVDGVATVEEINQAINDEKWSFGKVSELRRVIAKQIRG